MINIAKSPMLLRYDSEADVLYLSVGKPDTSSRTKEDSRGLLWRVSPDGTPKGVTVMAFHQLWAGKESELVEILSGKLHIEARHMKKELQSAH